MTINNIKLQVKRTNRKTIAIKMEYDGSVTVIAPVNASDFEIERVVTKNAEWIRSKSEYRKKTTEGKNTEPISELELEAIRRAAAIILPNRVKEWANRLGITYNRVTVKKMFTIWGSCSSKKNINLNCLLMLAPDKVIDYIIVHELAHLKHMDHSKAFYAFIDANFAYRKECQRWLKDEGLLIISRARRGINT